MSRTQLLSTILVASLSAQNSLVTLEEPGLQAMANTAGQTVPAPARSSAQFRATLGVTFHSPGGFAAVVDHGPLTPSAPNILGDSTSAGALTFAEPIVVRFWDSVDPTKEGVTTCFRARGDLWTLGSGRGLVPTAPIGIDRKVEAGREGDHRVSITFKYGKRFAWQALDARWDPEPHGMSFTIHRLDEGTLIDRGDFLAWELATVDDIVAEFGVRMQGRVPEPKLR